MGVKGLWSLLNPVARPVQIESLEGKRMAIDSSIWLYQFQATMRDKDGRVLVNAHVLGFLRRINKLLFHGIKPVFVFDGGAPALKRQTIAERKRRKAGAAANHAKMAEKLFAAQMRREAVKAAQAQRDAQESRRSKNDGVIVSSWQGEEGDVIAEDAVYLDQLEGRPGVSAPRPPRPPVPTSTSSRLTEPAPPIEEETIEQRRKRFRKHDPYKLPETTMPTVSTEEKPDARLATEAELQQFIEEMHPEDIDVESAEFRALPTEIQYEIIGDMRVRSRQQSHKRLTDMLRAAPTALDFSMAQIKHLSQRNALTQQLLTVTDMVGKAHLTIPVRIAAERNREYVLVKRGENEGGGWALGIREGTKQNPIKLESDDKRAGESDAETESESGSEESSDGVVEVPPPITMSRTASAQPLSRTPSVEPSRAPSTDSMDPDLREYRRQQTLKAIASRYAPSTSSATRRPPRSNLSSSMLVPTANDEALALALQQEELGSDEDEPDPELARALAISRWEAENVQAEPQDEDGVNEVEDGQTAVELVDQGDEAEPGRHPDSDESMEEVSLVPSGRSTPQNLDDTPIEEEDEDDFEVVAAPPSVSRKQVTRLPPPSAIPIFKPEAVRLQTDTNGSIANGSGKPASPSVTRPTHSKTAPTAHKLEQPKPALSPAISAQIKAPIPTPTPVVSLGSKKISNGTASDVSRVSKNDSDSKVLPRAPSITAPLIAAQPLGHTVDTSSEDADDQEYDSVTPLTDLSLLQPADAHWYQQQKPHASKPQPKKDLVPLRPTAMPDILPPAQNRRASPIRAESALPAGKRADGAVRRTASTETVDTMDEDMEDSFETRDGEEEDEDEEAVEWSRSPSPSIGGRPSLQPGRSTSTLPSELEDDEADMQPEDMVAEEDDYARFMAQIKNRDLNEVRTEIDDEIRILHNQAKVALRDSEEITHAMVAQIQTLLRHFGIPYITAPMEAEAQCAKLAELGLVDGVITDDSDVFLFGGLQCFKNIFNDAKYAECFLLGDIGRELSLTRERLISLAYLLGSDYTIGLPGVGPVVALELLANFPGSRGLDDFKDWWTRVQRGQDSPYETNTKWRQSFKKRYSHSIFLTTDWPNHLVREAYKYPTTDESEEPFHWGFPKLSALRAYLHEELSWSISKVDDELTPIVQRIARRGKQGALNKQSTLNSFFDTSVAHGNYAPRRRTTANVSKRLMAVIKQYREAEARLEGKEPETWGPMMQGLDEEDPKGRGTGKRRNTGSTDGLEKMKDDDEDDEDALFAKALLTVEQEQGIDQPDLGGKVGAGQKPKKRQRKRKDTVSELGSEMGAESVGSSAGGPGRGRTKTRRGATRTGSGRSKQANVVEESELHQDTVALA